MFDAVEIALQQESMNTVVEVGQAKWSGRNDL